MASPEPATLTIPTSHAILSVTSIGPQDTSSTLPAILLIHGNSFDSTIFKFILASPLSKLHRIIALDLPGHGQSANAVNPRRTYNQPGYADCTVELLNILGIKEAVILGWSLGGHIGIEMIPLFPGMKGLMIVGTPPVGHEDGELDKAFNFPDGWERSFAARDDVTPAELALLAEAAADKPPGGQDLPCEFYDCVKRTDQKARKLMFHHFAEGKCSDQKKIVRETKVPIAVVNGEKDPFINLEFIEQVEFGNVWTGKCISMPELLHAPFYGDPDGFQKLLESFVEDTLK
ncbi:putative alpha beta hydrolase [Venturia nashicola]|nr:putative alpha beta hydrolase [Venturia nashicola]